jgi:hypothetical protein
MTTQLTLPNIPTDVRAPWPLGVWLRVYTNSLLDDAPTTIGRLVGYGLHDFQVTVKLVNAHGGAEVPIGHVVGVISPTAINKLTSDVEGALLELAGTGSETDDDTQ